MLAGYPLEWPYLVDSNGYPQCYSHTWEFCIPDVHILCLCAVIYVLLFFGTRKHIYKQQLSVNECMRMSNLLDYHNVCFLWRNKKKMFHSYSRILLQFCCWSSNPILWVFRWETRKNIDVFIKLFQINIFLVHRSRKSVQVTVHVFFVGIHLDFPQQGEQSLWVHVIVYFHVEMRRYQYF